MKINWKRVLIAAVWTELIIGIIYVGIIYTFSGLIGDLLILLEFFVFTFLGGLWVGKKIKSRFFLHGVLLFIFNNIIFMFLIPLLRIIWGPITTERPSVGQLIVMVLMFIMKFIGCTLGTYIKGRRLKKLHAMQGSKT